MLHTQLKLLIPYDPIFLLINEIKGLTSSDNQLLPIADIAKINLNYALVAMREVPQNEIVLRNKICYRFALACVEKVSATDIYCTVNSNVAIDAYNVLKKYLALNGKLGLINGITFPRKYKNLIKLSRSISTSTYKLPSCPVDCNCLSRGNAIGTLASACHPEPWHAAHHASNAALNASNSAGKDWQLNTLLSLLTQRT